MTQETKKRIHLIYGIVLSIVTVFAGICFIAACLNIYYSGKAADTAQIYTRQIVAENFAKIAVPVYACLILVIGGMVLDLALPIEKKKQKPEKNLALILARTQEKAYLENCNKELLKAIHKQVRLRKACILASAATFGIGFVMFLIYACDPNHWDTNSTPSMAAAMVVMLLWLSIPFIITVLSTYLCRKSMATQIDQMRKAPQKTVQQASLKHHSTKAVSVVRIAILAIGVLLVVLGACNEGTADILTKAVNICTECVGLG